MLFWTSGLAFVWENNFSALFRVEVAVLLPFTFKYDWLVHEVAITGLKLGNHSDLNQLLQMCVGGKKSQNWFKIECAYDRKMERRSMERESFEFP